MAAKAENYLRAEQTQALDGGSAATERPGAPDELMLTDREFAQAVVDAYRSQSSQNEHAGKDASEEPAAGARKAHRASPGASPGASPAEPEAEPQDARPRYVVGKLEIGGGNAVMNSQILRSGAFSLPELGVPLPVVADRDSFEITLSGVSPTQDHADVLLYAVSKLDRAPDPKLGVSVSFTTHQLLKCLGWTVNSRSYEKLRRIVQDLSEIRLTYRDRSDPRNGRVTEGERVFNSVTRPEQNAIDQTWDIVLPVSLFRIFELKRNTLIDLRARAAIQSDFGRWLHAFVSSQKPGELRSYDARELCRAGGLRSERLTDDLKILRASLKVLEEGVVHRSRKGLAGGGTDLVKSFDPVVASGWSVEKEEGRWSLTMARL
mgnify:CR=1 FL=1